VEENGLSRLKNIDEIRAQPSSIRLCKIFFLLIFGDSFTSKLLKMNNYIKEQRNSKCEVFLETEFLTGIGLIIGAAEFSSRGKIYSTEATRNRCKMMMNIFHLWYFILTFRDLCPTLEDFRHFLPVIWWDDERKENGDEWWKFSGLVFKIFCFFSF
jgi:hypothetical protein